MMEERAQISAELLFLIGVLVIIVMMSVVFISQQQELSLAMAAARNGAAEGASSSSCAVYPDDTYREYSASKTSLLLPYSVKIVNISYEEKGYDRNFEKNWIQFKVYAQTSDRFDSEELVSIGDRINYNLRKSLAVSFNSTPSTNKLYNPVFSPHYVYTTANVKWI